MLIAKSPCMKPVLELIEKAQLSGATVLLRGETGTGKEIVAQTIARGSARRDRPFVPINCAALPDSLLESELFGHVRGSFTGAHRDHPGAFAMAHTGTLFLDEIGETSGAFQARLLRVLQEREVRPLGGTQSTAVDVRVIAATHRHLETEMKAGRFREDLYYRLAVFPIDLPPLRKRPEDIQALADHFIAHYAASEGKDGCALPANSRTLLAVHSWPGNVRELQNQIQRAVALADPGEPLEPHFFSRTLSELASVLAGEPLLGRSLREQLDRVEALLIARALDRHQGQKTRTATSLGITREGLYKKMKRLGIR